jgi:hypothetical protein
VPAGGARHDGRAEEAPALLGVCGVSQVSHSDGYAHLFAPLNNRFRPRLVVLRLRGFSLMFGIIPALKMHFRLRVESKPPSRLR